MMKDPDTHSMPWTTPPPSGKPAPMLTDLQLRLLPRYRVILSTELNRLNPETCATSDLETVGHKLKGNGSMYGFPTLSELGAKLETAAHTNNHGLAVNVLQAIRNEADRLGLLLDQAV